MESLELKNKLASALSQSDVENLSALSEEAMQQYPDEGFGYYYFGEKLLIDASNDMPMIEWAFSKASYLEQENIVYLKRYAVSLIEQYKYAEAGNIYAIIYKIDENDSQALFGLGRYELSDERKNYSAAAYYFSKIENPTAEVYQGLALAYMGLEDFETALGMIDYSLSLKFDIESAISKIQILDKTQNYTMVPSVYEQILELEPNNFGFQYEYAVSLFRTHEYANADDAFKKAFTLLPSDQAFDVSLYKPYAENAVSAAKYDEAIVLLNKCIAADTNQDTYLRELLAAAKAGKGDNEGALKEWDTIISMYSYNPLLQQIAQLGKAELLLKIGQLDDAEKVYDRIEYELAGNPNPPVGILQDTAIGKAKIFLARDNSAKSYDFAAKAIKLGSSTAKDFIKKNLLDYLAQTRQAILAANAGVAKNKNHALLKQLIGKAWAFSQFKLPVPEQFAADAEKKKQFEESVAKFQETLPEFALVIGEKEIFLNIPFSNPKKPIRNMAYVYEVEKEKDTLMQIKMRSIDGLDEFSAKIKVEVNNIVFSVIDGEVFKLEEIKNLDKISYKTQRNFVKHLGYLDLLNRYELEGDTLKAIDALLDY